MKYFRASFLITFCLISFSGFSQNEPTDIVNNFFTQFEEQGISVALDGIYSSNEWMLRSTDAISKLKSDMEGLNEEYIGKYYGYELIVAKELSDSYILMSYLVKYDRQPLRFTFQFYKPNNKWVVHSFQYDGNLSDEIEEAAKLYYLELKN